MNEAAQQVVVAEDRKRPLEKATRIKRAEAKWLQDGGVIE